MAAAVPSGTDPGTRKAVALLLPGQGAQYERMGAGLYGTAPGFTAAMDEVFAALGAAGASLRADWLAAEPQLATDDARWSQPLLFAVDYALGRMIMSWGVTPAVLLGHSVGELAAAALAGVLPLVAAARLIAARAGQLAAAPVGGMLVVAAGSAALAPFLSADVVIGAVNGPRQTVLAGLDAPLRAVEWRLGEAGITCRRSRSRTPFHSPVLAGVALEAAPELAGVPLRPPRIPIISGYTARPLDAGQASSPSFWLGQPSAVVRFADALDQVLRMGRLLLIEAGPGQGLSALALRHPELAARGSRAVAALPERQRGPTADRQRVTGVAAALREAGYRLGPAAP